MLILPFCMEMFSFGETAPDEIHFRLRRSDAFLRLLLEGVKDANRFHEAHRIDGAPSVPGMVRNDLEHRSTPEASEGLRRGVGPSSLGGIEGLTDITPDPGRKAPHVSAA